MINTDILFIIDLLLIHTNFVSSNDQAISNIAFSWANHWVLSSISFYIKLLKQFIFNKLIIHIINNNII